MKCTCAINLQISTAEGVIKHKSSTELKKFIPFKQVLEFDKKKNMYPYISNTMYTM
jgi:hypothetical protein